MTQAFPTIAPPLAAAAHRGRSVRVAITLIVLLVALVGACLARLMIGETRGWPESPEILSIRIDRLLVGGTVGAALAVAGAILQALLRNPLASPYIVGISSGASVGVMISWVGWLGFIGLGAVSDHVAALAGALASMAIVYALAQRGGRIEPLGLLLVGVIMNAINSAIMMFINYITPHGQRGQMALWMLGYLNENAGREAIVLTLIVCAIGIAVALAMARSMDIASFSDAEAHSMGVNLPRLRVMMFLVAGWLTAAGVVLAGPIGFVGLIAPHAVRLAAGPAHRPLIAGSALAGATLVIGADVGVKLLDLGYGLMPIGVVTALVGGPLFLFMLRSELRRRIAA